MDRAPLEFRFVGRVTQVLCRDTDREPSRTMFHIITFVPIFILPSVSSLTERAAPSGTAPLAETRPNILFAIADDWSFPHAGAYGDRTVSTPAFNRIAREGALFLNAFAGRAVVHAVARRAPHRSGGASPC